MSAEKLRRSFGDERSERGALGVVRAALDGIDFEHTGNDSSKVDGFIRMRDGSEIDLEVLRGVNSKFRQGQSEIKKMRSDVDLPVGSGTWVALLPVDTEFSEFSKLDDSIFLATIAGNKSIRGPNSSVKEVQIAGFAHILLMSVSGDQDVLTFGVTTASVPHSAFISTHPNSVGDYMKSVINTREAKILRLIDRSRNAGRVSHMAVVVEDVDNAGMQFSLFGIGAYSDIRIPQTEVQLPEGLDGFWVIRRDFRLALGYLRATRWMRYEVETP